VRRKPHCVPQRVSNQSVRNASAAREPTPNDRERTVLHRAFEKAKAHYQKNPEAARELLTVGQHPRDESLNPVVLAGYANVGQLILNLDEVLNRE